MRPFVFFTLAATCLLAQASAQDAGWPRQVSRNGNVLVYYQPQVHTWDQYKNLTADIAFSLTPKGDRQLLGVASITAGTLVDKEARTVYFKDAAIISVRFPSLHEDSVRLMEPLLRSMLPTNGEPVSVDRLMAGLEQGDAKAKAVELKNDPPPVFYSNTPAILLMVEGEVVLADIDKTHLQYVVNTNWDVFYDKHGRHYYLLSGSTWLTAAELKGPWAATRSLPAGMEKLPADGQFDAVKKMVPPPATSGSAPAVYFSGVPAELILTRGAPVYSSIPGTSLLYISNTENDVFLHNVSKIYYVLLSGRWFSAASLAGPWTFASDKLPPDFSRIPDNSPKAAVLASVPGTIQAADAVMLAQIPATAVVNKQEAAAKVHIHYDGEPRFSPIDNTKLEYAINTPDKVIKYGDQYYACYQAVWFVSSSPNGPWTACTSVPAEIYNIPPNSPVYNVTYVTQTNVNDATVETSVAAGYFGMFVLGTAIGAAIVYGTGWYYHPYFYWGPGMLWPVYRPWPCTYGAAAIYNPWTGGFAAGRAVYGPYGAAGGAAWYNPATGRYGRSASVQGWYGGRTVANAYNPWTGTYGRTSQGHNAFSQWGHSAATNGSQWVRSGHVTTAGGTTAAFQTSGGRSGVVHTGTHGTVVHTNNGVYAGHDGNVYRKNTNGGWSQYNNRSWHPANADEGLRGADQARQRGQVQSQRFSNFQRNSGGRMSGGHFGGFRRR
jgi:hypothetical protein